MPGNFFDEMNCKFTGIAWQTLSQTLLLFGLTVILLIGCTTWKCTGDVFNQLAMPAVEQIRLLILE
jgi:hypothetical protein